LTQLAEAIERADPVEIMESMSAARQTLARCRHVHVHMLNTLEDQVNRYDYDQALETIGKIRNS
jgi:hypothetical protein